MEIAVCRRGKGEVLLDKQRYPYEEGSVMIIPRNIPHRIIPDDAVNQFWEYIYVNPTGFMQQRGIADNRERKRYLNLMEHSHVFVVRESIPFLTTELNLLMDQLRVQEYGYRQCVRGLLYALLMEIVKINEMILKQTGEPVQQETKKSGRIVDALDFIEENYREKVQTEDIAAAVFVSANYLRKLFQDNFSMSPMQYVNHVRIQKACKLLRRTDDTVNEIAGKVGYDNVTTFINNFRQYTGQTPKQWKGKAE